jgi:hypothetical protein
MTQYALDFNHQTIAPWSGYGWIIVRGARLFALVYRQWNFWCAVSSENPGLKRQRHGMVSDIEEFGERVEELTTRSDN